MNDQWLQLITNQISDMDLNDDGMNLATNKIRSLDINNNSTIKMRVIKIKNKDNEYRRVLQQSNIQDWEDVDEMTQDDKDTEYQMVQENIGRAQEYEDLSDYELSDTEGAKEESDKFIDFNIAKTMQYRKRVCLDANNKMYKNLSYSRKNKLRTIDKKVDRNLSILKRNGIRKRYKMYRIKKLNRAIINFIEESIIVGKPIPNVESIIIKIRRLKIK